jgi:hypothetical protein
MDRLRRIVPTLIALFFSYLIAFKIDLGLDWIAKGILILVIFGVVYNLSARFERNRSEEEISQDDD